jgi:hypothetical protein
MAERRRKRNISQVRIEAINTQCNEREERTSSHSAKEWQQLTLLSDN